LRSQIVADTIAGMYLPRTTSGRLLVGAAAIVVLYGVVQFLSLVLEAHHNRRIWRHRDARRTLGSNREDYPPEYYERRMRELDAEALELEITK
jgi:hypothetical protein